VPLHRLNRREYANTLHDLLGVEPSIADSLPLDAGKGGFDNNASALGITPELAERYLAIAEEAVPAALVADPTRFIACEPASEAFDDACVQSTLVAFSERAWRRTLDDDLRGELEGLWTSAAANTETFSDAVTLTFVTFSRMLRASWRSRSSIARAATSTPAASARSCASSRRS